MSLHPPNFRGHPSALPQTRPARPPRQLEERPRPRPELLSSAPGDPGHLSWPPAGRALWEAGPVQRQHTGPMVLGPLLPEARPAPVL